MQEPGEIFYTHVLRGLIAERHLTRDMHVLVVCGGMLDRNVLHDLGFEHVIITNISTPRDPCPFAPFEWQWQQAEDLTLPDGSVDFCIVHSGLHHCHSPHRGLLEMYRVAKHGLVLFEPYAISPRVSPNVLDSGKHTSTRQSLITV